MRLVLYHKDYTLFTMASTFLTRVVFLALFCTLGSCVHIGINPQKFYEYMENYLFFTCRTDLTDMKITTLRSMQLNKNGQMLLSIDAKQQIHYVVQDDRFSGQGALNPNVTKEQSYLTIMLSYPTAGDAAMYTCGVTYNRRRGPESKQSSPMKVTVTGFGTLVSELKGKVAMLDAECKAQDIAMRELKSNFSYASAFSVGTPKKQEFELTLEKPFVFPDIIMQIGTAYDKATGVFTAERDGLYVFNLILELECTKCTINADIRANNKVLTSLAAGNKYSWDQSAITSVAHLKKGDKITAVPTRVDKKTTKLAGYRYCVFSGFLLKLT